MSGLRIHWPNRIKNKNKNQDPLPFFTSRSQCCGTGTGTVRTVTFLHNLLYVTYVNNAISLARDTRYILSGSGGGAPSASSDPWDGGFQDWSLSCRGGGENTSSISEKITWNYSNKLVLRTKSSVLIIGIRKCLSDLHDDTAGQGSPTHLGSCSPV